MATRSAIGIKYGTRIKAVYCHWDGYIDHVGSILDTYYRDSIKVSKLIAMGDLSNIGADIGEKHDFGERATYLPDGSATQCTFYTRDRGELAFFKSFSGEEEFVDYYQGCGSEYFYLYDHGVWYVKAYKKDFEPLHETIELTDKEKV